MILADSVVKLSDSGGWGCDREHQGNREINVWLENKDSQWLQLPSFGDINVISTWST